MEVLKIDLKELVDQIVNEVEFFVFDQNQHHQSFSLENKEAIQSAISLHLQKMFEEYSIVEIKNDFILSCEKKTDKGLLN